MSKRYGNLEVQMKEDDAWIGVASIDGGKNEGDKWIAKCGIDGQAYRVVRVYPTVIVKVNTVETRTVVAEVTE